MEVKRYAGLGLLFGPVGVVIRGVIEGVDFSDAYVMMGMTIVMGYGLIVGIFGGLLGAWVLTKFRRSDLGRFGAIVGGTLIGFALWDFL